MKKLLFVFNALDNDLVSDFIDQFKFDKRSTQLDQVVIEPKNHESFKELSKKILAFKPTTVVGFGKFISGLFFDYKVDEFKKYHKVLKKFPQYDLEYEFVSAISLSQFQISNRFKKDECLSTVKGLLSKD